MAGDDHGTEIYDNAVDLLRFSKDFFLKETDLISRKAAILTMSNAIELLLQERLAQTNPILVYENIHAKITDDAKTVGVRKALKNIQRIRNHIAHGSYDHSELEDDVIIAASLKLILYFMEFRLQRKPEGAINKPSEEYRVGCEMANSAKLPVDPDQGISRPRWESRQGDDLTLTSEAFVTKYYAREKAAVTPRPVWSKGGRYADRPAEFIAMAYAPEMAAGTLHRGLLDSKLAAKLTSWLRNHSMPHGLDIPTKWEWLRREEAHQPTTSPAQARGVLREYNRAAGRRHRARQAVS
jgi:hypothetical protein